MSLRILVFLGSTRDSTPPQPARLGLRVARACVAQLNRGSSSVELIDPLDFDLASAFKPHFSYARGKVPLQLESLAESIDSADGYVMVSPEYNHSMSPALAHLLNHFGSSLFSYKASAIVTYSAGQWGGARAGVAMRGFLSELGCLPVSAMIHVPKAQKVFDKDGGYLDNVDGQAWTEYFGRTLAQLEWWASAARYQRGASDPYALAPPFSRDPSQRNAP
ncbi:NAD(P)H-dependent oxidoreductase [Aquisalimonas sp.]|uniref:NADPH-dependent FMN reductase n=1 Tax=Aquisalimonas sp. TaxID=1872621 RepID=UPI0025BE94D8|nr:NAD(P)H-dependent oxidoreductase [Aquisalimonas sp.]